MISMVVSCDFIDSAPSGIKWWPAVHFHGLFVWQLHAFLPQTFVWNVESLHLGGQTQYRRSRNRPQKSVDNEFLTRVFLVAGFTSCRTCVWRADSLFRCQTVPCILQLSPYNENTNMRRADTRFPNRKSPFCVAVESFPSVL